MWSVSAGSGVPVVMIHGAFSDYRYWEPQLEAFGRTHRAIAVSLSGYHPDEPAAPESFSADRHVDEVGAFLTGLGERAHLIGHSRGGRVALHVAARFPGTVRSLVLVEPGGEMEPDFLPAAQPPPPSTPTVAMDVRKEAQQLIETGHHEAALRLYVDSGHGKEAWDRSPAIFRRVALSNTSTLAGMIGDRSAPLARAIAASIEAPTLLLGADKSPAIFGKIMDVLEICLSTWRRVTITNADHFMSLSAKAAFEKEVLLALRDPKQSANSAAQ